jgi:hypothetical protein
MKIISHRGNLNGPDQFLENNPFHIQDLIKKNLDVEIDVWYLSEGYFLGHDEPIYKIDESLLESDKLWCHAKNLAALYKMLKNSKIHCFWHEEDDFTITSKGYIWTYPEKEVTDMSIIVSNNKVTKNCYGVCTDFINIP